VFLPIPLATSWRSELAVVWSDSYECPPAELPAEWQKYSQINEEGVEHDAEGDDEPISVSCTRGSTASVENVPASTMPAEVITTSAHFAPSRVPCYAASSRTRVIRKTL